MSFTDTLLGRPLATSEERAEHIGVSAGIPIFGLDALTSAAYGPETALSLLIPLGLMGVQYIVPIISAILILLVIVYFSYRQTIAAYPGGGGSYTVATENLGTGAGLLAAAALMIDYILTAAVGISAGIEAVVSDQQWLFPHTLMLCLVVLGILALVNMRGVKDTGAAFIVPTFLFVGSLLTTIAVGAFHVFQTHGHPVPHEMVLGHPTIKLIGIWLLLKAFSNGCAAMTGVEAVSNGVMAFKEPRTKNAQRTLTVIISILIVLLFGTAWLAQKYQIMAMDQDKAGYQSLLSLIVQAVFGRSWFFHFTMWSIFLALTLSANTAFADFPRVTRAVALNDFLPHVFILRGRRLLFSHGIYALTGFTAVILLIAFDGDVDRLISLYAIGAFLAFTLSQAGMVQHWRKQGPEHKGRLWHMLVNGTGAVATGITTLIVLVAKFKSGAWVTALLVPTLILLMVAIKQHYDRVKVIVRSGPLNLSNLMQPLVVLPMARWDRMTEKALRFAVLLSKDIKVLNVDCDDGEESLCTVWEDNVLKPIREKGLPEPELITLHSTFRLVISPLMDYILEMEQQNPDRKITVLLPELVVNHWWENLLHNQRVQLLKLLLLLRGKQRIIVVDIPWYL